MEIIKILFEFIILLVCSLIQVVGVIIEGISKFFGKLADYLCGAYEWLMSLIGRRDKETEETTEDR